MIRNQWYVGVCYAVVILLLVQTTPSVNYQQLFSFGNLQTEEEQQTSTSTAPVLMYVTGDVFLGRAVERLMLAYGFDYPYRQVSDLLSGADIGLVNFESAIPATHVPTPDFGFQFSARTEAVDALRAWGVTHASLANNHSYDFGATGYRDTVSALEQSGIIPFGSPFVATSSLQLIPVRAETVAVVGITMVGRQLDWTAVSELLSAAKEQATFTVVYIHWGSEYVLSQSRTQRSVAQFLVDAGADAVIGHHPHVVQGVELHNGKPIFYSLGNFIFDQYFEAPVQEGLNLKVTLQTDAVEYQLQPVTSIGSRSQPRLMSAYERALFLNDLAKRSSPELQSAIIDGEWIQSR